MYTKLKNLYAKLILFQNLKKKYVIYPTNPFITAVIRKLVINGLLTSYRRINNNILIELKYGSNNQGVLRLMPITKLFYFKSVSYVILLKLKKECTLIILSTPKGLLNNSEAIYERIGGKIIGIFL